MKVRKRFDNDDVISYLCNCYNSPEIKIKNSKFLIAKLSYIPLGVVFDYKKYPNYDDLLQSGYETLWHAIMVFDINKSHNFVDLAYMWIRQKVARAALKEKIYFKTTALSGLAVTEDEDFNNLESSILKDEEKHMVNCAMQELDKSHRAVILGVYDNERSLRDLGQDMNTSHESVRKARDEATRTLKRIIDQRLVINT